jgi:hypothetical protein
MATLAIQPLTNLGTAITFAAAAAGGDQFANTGGETVLIRNTDASAKTVTFVATQPCDQGSLHNVVVVVASNVEAGVKGLNPRRFNDANRNTQITYSAVTNVVIAVIS